MKKNIIFITNIPTPYRVPVWNKLHWLLKKRGFKLHLFFMAKNETNRKWKIDPDQFQFDYKFLIGKSLPFRKGDWTLHINPDVIQKIKELDPQLIITGGYDSITSLIVSIFCRIMKIPNFLWYESPEFTAKYSNKYIRLIKKAIFNQYNGFIVPGKSSQSNIKGFNLKKSIFISPNSVNNEFFKSTIEHVRYLKEWKAERVKYPQKIIIYSGQLIERKGLPYLLEAFRKVISKFNDVGLFIIGSGNKEKEYKQLVKELNIESIYFLGHLQQEQLPFYYAMGDIFVLPSLEEVWGLVVNEAMCSGMAVLSSKYAGCSYDLIREGENGYIIDPTDTDSLERKLKYLLSNNDILDKMKTKSLDLIDHFSIDVSSERIYTSIVPWLRKEQP